MLPIGAGSTYHHSPSLIPTRTFTPLAAVHMTEALACAPAEGSCLDEAFVLQLPLRSSPAERLHAFQEACGKARPS